MVLKNKSMFKWLGEGYKKVVNPTKQQKFGILKDHPVAQDHAQAAVESHQTLKENIKALEKEFKIYRWNPDQPSQKPYLKSYFIDLATCGPMVCNIPHNRSFSSRKTYFYK